MYPARADRWSYPTSTAESGDLWRFYSNASSDSKSSNSDTTLEWSVWVSVSVSYGQLEHMSAYIEFKLNYFNFITLCLDRTILFELLFSFYLNYCCIGIVMDKLCYFIFDFLALRVWWEKNWWDRHFVTTVGWPAFGPLSADTSGRIRVGVALSASFPTIGHVRRYLTMSNRCSTLELPLVCLFPTNMSQLLHECPCTIFVHLY